MPDKYVVLGEWEDKEWQELAASYRTNVDATKDHSAETNAQYYRGPRSHPYGPHAFNAVVDGKVRVYPSRQHAIDDGAVENNDAPATEENRSA